MILDTITPTDRDVLMGQSPNLRLHPGNKRLKELVAERFQAYFDERTSKLDKTIIAKNIIQTINDGGGRFLKQPEKKRVGIIKDAVWVLEDDQIRIRDKVASQFRGHLKELKRRKPSDEMIIKPRDIQPNVEERQEQNTSSSRILRTDANLPLKKRKVKFECLEPESSDATTLAAFRDKDEFRKIFQQKAKEFQLKSKLKNMKTEAAGHQSDIHSIAPVVSTDGIENLPSGYKTLPFGLSTLCRLNDNSIVR